jgi:GMP synthase (glutamine-hydrolysing)
MARLAIVEHSPGVPLDRVGRFLDGHVVRSVWAPDDRFPRDVDAVVVMGGFMGAYEVERHPWLVGEKHYLAEMVAAGVPVLGICLGAQLLADALGGRAHRASLPEVGVVPVALTEAGREHPVARHLTPWSFVAHSDTFEVPRGARLLARSDRHPLAFDMGSALALQPHPEAEYATVATWFEQPDFDLLDRAGQSGADVLDDLRSRAHQLESAAGRLLGAWFDSVGEERGRYDPAR